MAGCLVEMKVAMKAGLMELKLANGTLKGSLMAETTVLRKLKALM